MREQNMDFLFALQMQNYKIHKYNMLTHIEAFVKNSTRLSCILSPKVFLENVWAFLK